MKEQITKILSNIPLDIRLPWKERLVNHNKAADELTALMCYREVRAIMISKATYPTVTFECQMFAYLKEYYSEQAIREAIEKFKNEQK